MLLAADIVGRVLVSPGELQVGVVLGVLGAPAFIAARPLPQPGGAVIDDLVDATAVQDVRPSGSRRAPAR